MRTLKFREAKGGVAAANGFSAAGGKDIQLILSDRTFSGAAAFSGGCGCHDDECARLVTTSGQGRAMLLIRNVQNYDEKDVEALSIIATSDIGLKAEDVLITSSCVGKPLPLGDAVRGIVDAIDELQPGESGGAGFAKNMPHSKSHALRAVIDGCVVTIGGACSCSPKDCNVTCIITADVSITPKLLEKLTKDFSHYIFCEGVSGTLMILANGACGKLKIKSEDVAYGKFREMLAGLYNSFATPSCACHKK